jgi:hypothetical protein
MIDWDSMLPGGEAVRERDAAPEPKHPAADALADSIQQRTREGDNRRRCLECGKHAPNGRCLAAAKGEIVASSSYQPNPMLLRRCEGFRPLPNDPDQRSGWDRWPGLPGTLKR